MTRKQRRLTIIGLAGVVLLGATGLVTWALNDRIVYFNTPSDIHAQAPLENQRIRLGGMIEAGSVQRSPDGLVTFTVGDGFETIAVSYRGILPDLFREQSGVIAEGVVVAGGGFVADTVLAKHDESYMPPEVAEALRERAAQNAAPDLTPAAP